MAKSSLNHNETQHEHFGFLAWAHRPLPMQRAHYHLDVEVNFVVNGTMTYLYHGKPVSLPVGRMCLIWAALPHQTIHVDPEVRMGLLVIPITWLWSWGCPDDLARLLLSGSIVAEKLEDSSISEIYPDDMVQVERWDHMLQHKQPSWEMIVRLEVEARLRRFMLGQYEAIETHHDQDTNDHSSPSRTGITPMSVQRMAHLMTHRIGEDLTVERIAQHVHLHPSHAMRIFKQSVGMSMMDYLTRSRVAEAQRRLITSDEPILQIAEKSGFRSSSRFYQAFKRITGFTPRKYRTEHRLSG